MSQYEDDYDAIYWDDGMEAEYRAACERARAQQVRDTALPVLGAALDKLQQETAK